MPKGIYVKTKEHNRKNSEAHKDLIPWNKNKKLFPLSEEHRRKIGEAQKGKKLSQKTKSKISKANKGKLRYDIRGDKNPSKRLEVRIKISLSKRGERNHFWQGGIAGENQKIRNSLEYKIWRKQVFERDNYVCMRCGNNKSGNLNADHIKPFSLFPELRFAIDNGRTLCVDCHNIIGWNWLENHQFLKRS